jgi:hypothetical protein
LIEANTGLPVLSDNFEGESQVLLLTASWKKRRIETVILCALIFERVSLFKPNKDIPVLSDKLGSKSPIPLKRIFDHIQE